MCVQKSSPVFAAYSVRKEQRQPHGSGFGYAYPTYITDAATAKLFLGGISDNVYGPGFQRMDMSVFKRFHTFEHQYVEIRADGFNMFNTPAYGGPSGRISNTGGQITSAHTTQAYTPNARFFELAGKYVF